MKYLNKLFAWMSSDGMMHVILSAFICAILNIVLPWELAGMITFAIGIGKELYDKYSKKGCAEWKDLFCDLFGILLGIL